MARNFDLDPALTKDRAALVLFDTLNGYLHPDDPVKEENLKNWRIRENMTRLVNGAHDAGLIAFYAAADHAADGADVATRLTDTDMDLNPWGERERRFLPAHRHGQESAAIAPEVAPKEGDVMVPKHRWSAFHQTHLDLQLRVRGLSTIVIAGGSTDVGIASTVFAARDLDYGIVVVSDCCYSHRGNNNAFFMERVFPRMGRVMTTDEAIALMKG
ncbi:MAG: cysteine hydrolase [Alphaproteobacteria bacterium]|nr:cysteine hydrolase [Alphaproteobacteria bacterium]